MAEPVKASAQEMVTLFGQHALELATKKGIDYYVRHLAPRDFREASRGLRLRIGAERNRFARSLPPDLQGALIHALTDPVHWDRLVLEAAARRLPDTAAGGAAPRKVRPVETRRMRSSSRLDRDPED